LKKKSNISGVDKKSLQIYRQKILKKHQVKKSCYQQINTNKK